MLFTFWAKLNPFVKENVVQYITEDIRELMNLAMDLLYEEYVLLRDAERSVTMESPQNVYNLLLCSVLTAIGQIEDKDRDDLLAKWVVSSKPG